MPPRRSHKKSRAGCRRCKARKIKCDECHPRCGNCVKHGVACDFEHPEVVEELRATNVMSLDSPAASGAASATTPFSASTFDFKSPLLPSASASSSAGGSRPTLTPLCRPMPTPIMSSATPEVQRMLEMRLIHHYTATTCKSFTFMAPHTEEVWKLNVPRLAFSGASHLTNAILAVAALHLRSQNPTDTDLVRASHAYMAASLADYSASLNKGIDHTNAESLFLTSALIAFQSTASRVFVKDEVSPSPQGPSIARDRASGAGAGAGGYAPPLSWFHSFQGVKAVTAASWQWLRSSPLVTQVINSQVVLQLDFEAGEKSFFGHLLDELEEELKEIDSNRSGGPSSADSASGSLPPGGFPSPKEDPYTNELDIVVSTRQAYQHAVAVLNWAHKIPHKGSPLPFPATVSRRFIELIEERRPRAMAILACYFALLKSLDNVWWLHGLARREVLGVVSLFNSDYFGPDAYHKWWPHLEWAMRIALYDDGATGGTIPAEIWGADWLAEEQALAEDTNPRTYYTHIEMLSQMVSPAQSLPAVPASWVQEGFG